jgi:hypothetical protein
MRLLFASLALIASFSLFAGTPVLGGYQEVIDGPPVVAGRSFNVFMDAQVDPFSNQSVFVFGALNTYENDGNPVTLYFGGILDRSFDREFLDTGVFAFGSLDLFRPTNGTCFGCPPQVGQSDTIGSVSMMWTDNRNVEVDVVTDSYGSETMVFEAAYMTDPIDQLLAGDWSYYVTPAIEGGLPSNYDAETGTVSFEMIDEYDAQEFYPIFEPDQPLIVDNQNQFSALSIWKGSEDGLYYAKRLIRSSGAGSGHYIQNRPQFRLLVSDNLVVGYAMNSCTVQGGDCEPTTYGSDALGDSYFILRRDIQRWSCDPADVGQSDPFLPPPPPCNLLELNLELP